MDFSITCNDSDRNHVGGTCAAPHLQPANLSPGRILDRPAFGQGDVAARALGCCGGPGDVHRADLVVGDLRPAVEPVRSVMDLARPLNSGDASPSSGRRILFLDSRLETMAEVLEWLTSRPHDDLTVVILDRDADGIGQIARHVRAIRDVGLLMIAAADERGRLTLGCSSLTVGNLYAFEDDLCRIGAALAPAGRICVFGRASQAQSDTPLQIMLSRLAWAPVEFSSVPVTKFELQDQMAATRDS